MVEVKATVAEMSAEERLEIAAFIAHLNRADSPEYQSELDRRMSAMDSGKNLRAGFGTPAQRPASARTMKPKHIHVFMWRKYRVFIVCAIIVFVYFRLRDVTWCSEFAKNVSLTWKIASFCAFIVSVFYSDWRIYRRLIDPRLPKLHGAWLAVDIFWGYIFALFTADSLVMFWAGTLCLYVATRLYEEHTLRRCKKSDDHERISSAD